MRARLLELLACPACGGDLSAGPALGPDDDVQDGELRCACGEVYPILSGVPSMIPTAGNGRPRPDPRTPQSFGLQWTTYEYGDATWFKDLDLRVAEIPKILDVDPAVLKNSLLLDGGCGHGALTAAATRLGCETVGLDMSAGVFKAEERRKSLPEEEASRVHYVHGDILRPPLKQDVFPFIMSIGVLHHTPAPEDGFQALAKRLQHGGRFYIQMYRTREPWIGVPNAALRALTCRLPPKMTMALCTAALPVHTAAVKVVAKLRGEETPIGDYSKRERLISLFDNFSPRYQYRYTSEEVMEIYRRAELTDIHEVTLENERRQSVGVVGVRP